MKQPRHSEPTFQNKEKEKSTEKLIIPVIKNEPEPQKDEEYLRHLASIVESSDDAIISKSIDGTIKSWNKGGEKMFGYRAKEVVGKNISLIIPPEYVIEEKKIVERIRNNEIITHYETVRNKKGGERFYVSLTVSPLKDGAGNIIGISKIARDITSQKKSEAELILANKELAFQNKEKGKRAAELIVANKELAFQNDEKESRAAELAVANKELVFQNDEKEKRAAELIIAIKELKKTGVQLQTVNKDLESFSYSVSHDLRSPLRSIHYYTQILKEDFGSKLDSEANRMMDNIMKNAKKMGQLIDDLLTFSRIGRKELRKNDINMNDMVSEICKELKNEQGIRDIEFHILQLLPVQADKVTIRQVWLNLISNAIKYSKLKEKSIIEIGSEIKDGELIYHVKDNGAGFDMRFADKLFGVFQRLHSDDEFEGTGVGLAIVQLIISKHGGRIWAEGKVDEGAVFYFTLNKAEQYE